MNDDLDLGFTRKKFRAVFRTLSNICNGTFCENT